VELLIRGEPLTVSAVRFTMQHSNHDVFPEYLEEQKDEDVGPSVGMRQRTPRYQGVPAIYKIHPRHSIWGARRYGNDCETD